MKGVTHAVYPGGKKTYCGHLVHEIKDAPAMVLPLNDDIDCEACRVFAGNALIRDAENAVQSKRPPLLNDCTHTVAHGRCTRCGLRKDQIDDTDAISPEAFAMADVIIRNQNPDGSTLGRIFVINALRYDMAVAFDELMEQGIGRVAEVDAVIARADRQVRYEDCDHPGLDKVTTGTVFTCSKCRCTFTK